MSGSVLNLIIGVVLVIASVWWIVSGSSFIQGLKDSASVTSRPALLDLVVVLNGSVPLFLILVGIMMIWLEWDSFRASSS